MIILIIFRFIILIFIQIFILNKVYLGGYINPYLYVLFILTLPFNTPKWLLLPSAFLCGLVIDYFSNSLGMNAAACTFIGFMRPVVLQTIMVNREFSPGDEPGIGTMSPRWFFIYASIMVVIHHLILFYIEVFRFSEFFVTFFRAMLSSAVTLILISITQFLFFKIERRI